MLVEQIVKAARSGNKVLICGNGGLAAEAEHFAAELMGKYAYDVYLPCIALTTNSSLITALANDLGYENVFSHQVAVLGQPGDFFIGMTTSASPNVLKAFCTAQEKGLITYLLAPPILLGSVPEKQEQAIKLLHKVAYEVKKRLYETGGKPEQAQPEPVFCR